MTDGMKERAAELGRLLGQSDEYKALGRARDRLLEDAQAVESMNRLDELERGISEALQRGEEPDEATKQEYEGLFMKLQSAASYQGMVAAQSNFDKLLARVNQEISRGIETGSQSRIILPS
jgi:cell fate (sporulation/competence/biofilm development) regulator YlbF (YheA/YmcA/DUF963 family)